MKIIGHEFKQFKLSKTRKGMTSVEMDLMEGLESRQLDPCPETANPVSQEHEIIDLTQE